MKDSARYVKWVKWSEQAGCFVGQCPGTIGPCCHGDDETVVYAELGRIMAEWIEIIKVTANHFRRPLPGEEGSRGSWPS